MPPGRARREAQKITFPQKWVKISTAMVMIGRTMPGKTNELPKAGRRSGCSEDQCGGAAGEGEGERSTAGEVRSVLRKGWHLPQGGPRGNLNRPRVRWRGQRLLNGAANFLKSFPSAVLASPFFDVEKIEGGT